jgi:hypothetical protein
VVDVHEHYRPTTDDYPPGVYRVVGTRDPAALLRVTDADGRRASTGHLERVPRSDLDDCFEPAADPDAGIDPVSGVMNALQGLYWQVRTFL